MDFYKQLRKVVLPAPAEEREQIFSVLCFISCSIIIYPCFGMLQVS